MWKIGINFNVQIREISRYMVEQPSEGMLTTIYGMYRFKNHIFGHYQMTWENSDIQKWSEKTTYKGGYIYIYIVYS